MRVQGGKGKTNGKVRSESGQTFLVPFEVSKKFRNSSRLWIRMRTSKMSFFLPELMIDLCTIVVPPELNASWIRKYFPINRYSSMLASEPLLHQKSIILGNKDLSRTDKNQGAIEISLTHPERNASWIRLFFKTGAVCTIIKKSTDNHRETIAREQMRTLKELSTWTIVDPPELNASEWTTVPQSIDDNQCWPTRASRCRVVKGRGRSGGGRVGNRVGGRGQGAFEVGRLKS